MKTTLRIPSQLFLAAGKEVESALREATIDALLEHDWRYPIATWEDGKVVIIYNAQALDILAQLRISLSSDAPKEGLISPQDSIYPFRRNEMLGVVLNSALQIYIKDEKLHLEFPSENQFLVDLLMKPENADVLRNICRNITGREMATHVMTREADQTRDNEFIKDVRWRADKHNLAARRKLQHWLLGESRVTRLIMDSMKRFDSSPDRLRMPQSHPHEGDDLTSHQDE